MLQDNIDELKSHLEDQNAPFGVDLLIPQIGGNARKTNVSLFLCLPCDNGQLTHLGTVRLFQGSTSAADGSHREERREAIRLCRRRSSKGDGRQAPLCWCCGHEVRGVCIHCCALLLTPFRSMIGHPKHVAKALAQGELTLYQLFAER